MPRASGSIAHTCVCDRRVIAKIRQPHQPSSRLTIYATPRLSSLCCIISSNETSCARLTRRRPWRIFGPSIHRWRRAHVVSERALGCKPDADVGNGEVWNTPKRTIRGRSGSRARAATRMASPAGRAYSVRVHATSFNRASIRRNNSKSGSRLSDQQAIIPANPCTH
jgi:hypothetical protein